MSIQLRQQRSSWNREIVERFGRLSYSATARVSQGFQEKMAKNMTLRRQVEEIDTRISNVKD